MLLLTFLPLYAVVLAANLAPAHRAWQWATTAALLALSALVMLSGLGLLVAPEGFIAPSLDSETVATLDTALAGGLTLLTGVLGALLLVPTVRAALIRGLRLALDPANAVHTVALVLAVWLAGLTLAQLLLIQGVPVETLTAGTALTVGDLWEQGIAFVLFALLGVGLGLRRSLQESLARLGLAWPTLRQGLIAVVVIAGLTVWDGLLSLAWQAIDPASYERITGISEGLFAGVMTPIGAISIGLTAGIGEELLFRGAIQPRFGLLLATILFTVGHTQYELSPALFSVFVIGLVLGLVRRRANTSTAILIHAGYNTLNVLLWG